MTVLFVTKGFLFNTLELFQGHLFIREADVDEVLHNLGWVCYVFFKKTFN